MTLYVNITKNRTIIFLILFFLSAIASGEQNFSIHVKDKKTALVAQEPSNETGKLEIAKELFDFGQYRGLEVLCNNWLKLADPYTHPEEMIWANFYLSKIRLQAGYIGTANFYKNQAFRTLDKIKSSNDTFQIHALVSPLLYMLAGDIYMFKKEYEKAQKEYQKVNDLTLSSQNENELIYWNTFNLLNIARVKYCQALRPDAPNASLLFEEADSILQSVKQQTDTLPSISGNPGRHRLLAFRSLYQAELNWARCEYWTRHQSHEDRQQPDSQFSQLTYLALTALDNAEVQASRYENAMKKQSLVQLRILIHFLRANVLLKQSIFDFGPLLVEGAGLDSSGLAKENLLAILENGKDYFWQHEQAKRLILYHKIKGIADDLRILQLQFKGSEKVADSLMEISDGLDSLAGEINRYKVNGSDTARRSDIDQLASKFNEIDQSVDLARQTRHLNKVNETLNRQFIIGLSSLSLLSFVAILYLLFKNKVLYGEKKEKELREKDLEGLKDEFYQTKSQLDKFSGELEKKSVENQVLRREMSHRIQNHLVAINSRLKWDLRNKKISESPVATEALKSTVSRIQSVMVLHKLLNEKEGSGTEFIDLQAYLKESWGAIVQSLGFLDELTSIDLNLRKLYKEVPYAVAYDIGSLITELAFVFSNFSAGSIENQKLRLEADMKEDGLVLSVSGTVKDPGCLVKQLEEFKNNAGERSPELNQKTDWEKIELIVKQKYGGSYYLQETDTDLIQFLVRIPKSNI